MRIVVWLTLIDNIKYLIDKDNFIYHYSDHIRIGVWDDVINYIVKSQEEYNLLMNSELPCKLIRISDI
jgi:hypothetical protein